MQQELEPPISEEKPKSEDEPSESVVELEELEELKNKLSTAYQKDRLGTYEKILEFDNELEKKYPDRRRRILFHLLIGSTPPESVTNLEDFPGDDSIINFINSL